MCLGCPLYAYAVILLFQSVTAMQSMLDTCDQFAGDADMKFNVDRPVATKVDRAISQLRSRDVHLIL